MRVIMKHNITGFRNGEEWPAVGQPLECSDAEGHDLMLAGYAEASTEPAAAKPAPANRAKTAPNSR